MHYRITNGASDSVAATGNGCDTDVIHLADDVNVHLRPVCRDYQDDEGFRRLFFTLSDTTRYLYFSGGVPSNDTWAERFVALGHANDRDSYVLVAEVEDDLVGFARFSRSSQADPETVDVGILLTDAWQSRGLGTQMLCKLAYEARRRAIKAFTAVALWENRRMLRLAHRLFPDMCVTCGYGSCELSIDL
jgi:RimJ/RimL family protein N-acetyltransferase